ncbi:hypothetical protein, partial [Pseudomonas sp. AGC67]
PKTPSRSCLTHCSALIGAASRPNAGQARSPQLLWSSFTDRHQGLPRAVGSLGG